jgi:2-haloacid dehalogenase
MLPVRTATSPSSSTLARHAGLTWDCILSAEITGAFKPAPECYLNGARLLGLDPSQVMMVAAHKGDLRAAQKAGLHAAFIPRPAEAGPSREVDLSPDPAFDYTADSFTALADMLGCP